MGVNSIMKLTEVCLCVGHVRDATNIYCWVRAEGASQRVKSLQTTIEASARVRMVLNRTKDSRCNRNL
jgi:hypothetical protein